MSDVAASYDDLVTIGDLIDDPTLEIQAAYPLPEAGGVQVSWVHATEQIDPRPHLRRHELVCTLGSSLVEVRSARKFVDAVAEAGVAGIALGLGEVHLEPPQALVDACRRTRLPLLLIPHGVPFLAVNDAVLKKRSEKESESRRKETSLLSRLFVLARAGETETQLLDEVRSSLGCEIHVSDEDSTIRFEMPPGAKTPSPEFVEQLASLREFSRREHVRAASEKYLQVGQLIDLISRGLAHPAATVPELEIRGLDVSLVRVSSWPRGSEEVISSRWPAAVIGVLGNETIAITSDISPQELMNTGLVCGYSSVVGIANLRRALSEARTALTFARSKGGVAGPGDVVTLDALLEQAPSEQLTTFVEQLLGPIESAEGDRKGNLQHTLTTYIDLNQGLQETANRLGVHVNTVRNRLERIRALTGRDPQNLRDCVDLYIAVWAAENKRRTGHRLIKPLS